MFGKKRLETLYFQPGDCKEFVGKNAEATILNKLLDEYYSSHDLVPYKGRRVWNKQTLSWDVELKEYPGILLCGIYFQDYLWHYVQDPSEDIFY